VGSTPIVSSNFMTRSEANVSICLERALMSETERERNWWLNEANMILMSEEKKPEQQLAEEMLENLRRNVAKDKKRRDAQDDEPNIHGVCCQ